MIRKKQMEYFGTPCDVWFVGSRLIVAKAVGSSRIFIEYDKHLYKI